MTSAERVHIALVGAMSKGLATVYRQTHVDGLEWKVLSPWKGMKPLMKGCEEVQILSQEIYSYRALMVSEGTKWCSSWKETWITE